jgi:hypothetical protein
MSPLDYCIRVQEGLRALKIASDDPRYRDWFAATGRIAIAVGHAIECRDAKALLLAEPIAERWGIFA